LTQASKNIRAALAGLDGDTARGLAQDAARWIADEKRPALRQQQIAVEALLEGRPLDECSGPYGSVAQCRAFAAGSLRGALCEISAMYHQQKVNARVGRVVAELKASRDYWRASANAAWRASGHEDTSHFVTLRACTKERQNGLFEIT